MKQIVFLIVAGIFILKTSNAQLFRTNGLEFYNNYLNNPAFIDPYKNVQFDFIGYTQWTKFKGHPLGYFANSLFSFDKINSSFRLGYDFDKAGSATLRNFHFGYSYKYKANDKLSGMIGISLNPYKYEIDIYESFFGTTYYKHEVNSFDLGIGTGIEYKDLIIGVSTKVELSKIDNFKLFAGKDSIEKSKIDFYNFHFFSRYSFMTNKKLNFHPQISLLLYDNYLDRINRQIDFGILADYNDKFGLGVIIGSNIKLMANINIFDTVRLYLVFLNGNSLIYDEFYGWTLTGQIRINI